MSARSLSSRVALVAVVALGAVGATACASAPPQQLLTARDAYREAADGPASASAPADLKTAEQALQKAERSFKEDGASADTIDLAYIAERRAEIATAIAQRKNAEADKVGFDKQRTEVSDKMRVDAVDQLKDTKQQLGRTEAQVAAEQAARLAAERDTKRANQDADKAKADAAAAKAKVDEMRTAMARWAQLSENERGLVITLSSGLLFKTGKSDVLPAAGDKLIQIAALMRASPERRVTVEGHTDNAGDDASNQVLSQARADSVRSYLIVQGVPAATVSAVGFGEGRPVTTNGTVEGRATNRRVEIVLAPLPVPTP